MQAVFQLCRKNKWEEVMRRVQLNPRIALSTITMDNHILTTIMHQAITSKGNVALRAQLIRFILHTTPEAAAIKNGYGSLPLHVICQRNTKLNAKTKEKLIFEIVAAYKEALVLPGGNGKRTPCHVIFTDYVSARLTQTMVDQGAKACFLKDSKGWLPVHVACSRHCSPEKLLMLLQVHPECLYATTNDGQTPLSLAKSTATKTHPNQKLIKEIKKQLGRTIKPLPVTTTVSLDADDLEDYPKRKNDAFDINPPKRPRLSGVDDPARLLLDFSKHVKTQATEHDHGATFELATVNIEYV
jgi:hypothetical protein